MASRSRSGPGPRAEAMLVDAKPLNARFQRRRRQTEPAGRAFIARHAATSGLEGGFDRLALTSVHGGIERLGRGCR